MKSRSTSVNNADGLQIKVYELGPNFELTDIHCFLVAMVRSIGNDSE